MVNSKIVCLLQKLRDNELKEIRNWIRYKAEKRNSYRLLEYLLKNLHTTNPKKLDKEKIFRSLFPAAKYNDLKMRFMSFELLRFCEEYIVFQNSKRNNVQYQFVLLQFYRKRHMTKFFEQ